MEQNSPDASIFILIHKMDLVAKEDRERAFEERSALIQSRSQQ
jgi:Ras-related GTP-binding protein A/B